MALLKVICWALIFIIRIRFPPGKSLVTILNNLALDWFCLTVLLKYKTLQQRISQRCIKLVAEPGRTSCHDGKNT